MKLATQNHHATEPYSYYCCTVMQLSTELYTWSCCMQNTMQLQTCNCCHAECHTASNMKLLPCRIPHSFTIQLLPCRWYHTVTLGHSQLSVTMHCCVIMQQHHAVVTVVKSQHATCNICSITMGLLPCCCRAGTPCNFPVGAVACDLLGQAGTIWLHLFGIT